MSGPRPGLCVLLVLTACAGQAELTAEDLAALQERIAVLEAQNEDLEERVQAFEASEDLDALEARVGAAEEAIVTLGETCATDEDLAALGETLDAQQDQLGSLETDLATTDASLALLGDSVSSLSEQLSSLSAEVAALVADYSMAELAAYLPSLDDLFSVVSVDTAGDLLSVSAALYVSGEADFDATLSATDNLYGPTLNWRNCDGETYDCTPIECLEECVEHGERMATKENIYAWALKGDDFCEWVWYVDVDDEDYVYRGYPMYTNQTTPGCGTIGTGDMPRIEGGYPNAWDTDTEQSCACVSTI